MGAPDENIIGVDGWMSSTTSTTAFIVDSGPTRPEAAGPASQMGMYNENAHFWRVFSEPNDTKVMVSFVLYAGNAGNDNCCFWVLLLDSTPSGNDDIAMQLFFAKDDTQTNATGYFQLKNGIAEIVAQSPDIAGITHSTWYEVIISFDLTDTTGGPNGTYNLTITNLSLPSPAVVWRHTDEAIADAVDDIDKFYLGTVVVGATRTLVDDITFELPPASCQEVWNDGFGMDGDLNEDCYMDLLDFAIFAEDWFRCNDPCDPNCEDPLGIQ